MALVNSIRRSIGTVVDGTLHARFNSNSSLPPSSFLGSWKVPRNPRVAQERLAKLRKDYEKQVKELRKQYQNEMEFKRLEEQAKREADRESIRVAREERKALKRQQSQERALQRRQQEEEFKEMLVTFKPRMHKKGQDQFNIYPRLFEHFASKCYFKGANDREEYMQWLIHTPKCDCLATKGDAVGVDFRA